MFLLVFCAISLSGALAQKTFSGKVTSAEDGLGLPGVNVVVKGNTAIGTATDLDGKWTLKVPSDGSILIFTAIGMKPVEVVVSKSANVIMKPDATLIDEVVVTGFQKIDKRLFTGSAVRLNSDDVKIEGVSDVSRSLQGQVAGVQVENVSGTFGATPIVRVRGVASINGTNRPLWVIDGVVMEDAIELSAEDLTSGDLSTVLGSSTAGLNPEDVASFQILKDASATALYGARAMNGVIVITTKRAKAGRLSVNYKTNLTLRTKPSYKQFDIMSSGEEMYVYQELYEKGWLDIVQGNTSSTHGALSKMFYEIAQGNLPWGKNGGLNYDYLQHYADANTDWFDTLFKNSISQQHSLSFNAGNDKSTVRASIGVLEDPGTTLADKVSNYTGSINADFKLSDKLKVGMKISGNVRDQKLAASENRNFNALSGEYERNFDINPFNYALYTSRSITPYNKQGEREYFRRNYAPFNILDELEYNKLNLNLSDITFQADLNYKINNAIDFRTSLQGRWYRSKAVQDIHEKSNNANAYRADNPIFRDYNRFLFDDPEHPELPPYSVLPNGGFKKTTENELTSYFIRNIIDYNPELNNEDHVVTFSLGQEVRYVDRSKDYLEGWGYIFEKGGLILSAPDFIRYLDARGQDYFSHKDTRNRSFGAFITGGYSYRNKYIVNGTFRYDGDNRTGSSRAARYLPTWNVSGAWNVTEEKWMKNIEWLNMLKLKATYGLTGDNPVNASAALSLYGREPLRPHLSEREAALYIDALENSDLTFEKQYEFNLGLEASLFGNRIYTELEYYHRNSKDLLGLIETNGVGGISYKFGNIGEMKIDGIDATLRTTNIETQNFKWVTTFTYSYNKNEITKWQSRDRIGDAVRRTGANLVGYSQGALFSIPFAGLDKDGIPTFYGPDGEIVQEINMQEREDITKYLKYEGPTAPKGNGGLVNSFSYKNWNLDLGFVYRYGNKIRLDDAYYGSYSDFQALPEGLKNRWQFPGDEKLTNIPAIITPIKEEMLETANLHPYRLYNKSDLRVADGDFVRLKSVKLSYKLPQSVFKNSFIKAASVNFSAYNLWLLYSDDKLNGLDPEFYQSGGISLPLSSSYTFTLNLKF